MERYDVAVLGVGGMGSAAVAHLARRGARVIGLEQFPLGHTLGASAGRSRIIRKAYFEDTRYVPLLERAYTLWRELERRTSRTLLDLFGVLIVGQPEAEAVRGMQRSSSAFDVPVETLDTVALRARYPQFCFEAGEVGLLEPEAGAVFPEAAIAAHLDVARDAGATLAGETRVRSWSVERGGVRVSIVNGSEIVADRLVVTAGPWLPDIFASLGLPIVVQRNVQYWFEPLRPMFAPQSTPAFLIERDALPTALYGFPDLGDGFKVALHAYGERTRADGLVRDVSAAEIDAMRDMLATWAPHACGAIRSVKACMYSNTPDTHFAIGAVPGEERIIVAGGFSGHGYKFTPVIGEILADLALDGATAHPIEFLSLGRAALR